MTPDTFRQCVVENPAPPAGLPTLQQSLWWALKGDWDRAHTIVQSIPGEQASWAHANLHREEGDLANAQYWYARAGRHMPDTPIAVERDAIIGEVLAR